MIQIQRQDPTDSELGYDPNLEVEGWDKISKMGDYQIVISNAPIIWWNVIEALEDEEITQEQHDDFIAAGTDYNSYDELNDYFISKINW